MKEITRRIQALEAAAKKCGVCFTVTQKDGTKRRTDASGAIQLVRDARARGIEIDKGVRGCGELLDLLTDLIEG